MPSSANFFVPGRVCLVGEHSDWCGGLRSSFPALAPGLALVSNTREGLRVRASRTASKDLVLTSSVGGLLSVEPDSLLAIARGGEVWRYAAGVAYIIGERWGIYGASIAIESDLPAAKGLSSSAAVCLAVVRAFSLMCGLGLSVGGEMEVAWAGERLTGSLCGRMDQCVGFGKGAVATMRFDGEIVSYRMVAEPEEEVFVVFADLGGVKDTTVILRDLQSAVTRGETGGEKRLIEALGKQNEDIVERAAEALERGDAEKLGTLFREAQATFDAAAVPICPQQLSAPRLHEVMAHPKLQPYIWGAKGVGSQGDGTVQFVARGEAEAEELILALQNLCMPGAYLLRLGGSSQKEEDVKTGSEEEDAKAGDGKGVEELEVKRKVKTAVIAAAGFGTRLFPASRSIRPKSLFPILDSDGLVKPLLLYLVELCVREGIEKVVIVTGPGEQVERVHELFSPVEEGLAKALAKKKNLALYAKSIEPLSEMVKVAVQESPEGFGDAVAKAAPFLAEDEPFALLLGDVVFKTPEAFPNCLRQCLDIFERDPSSRSVIGVSNVSVADAGSYGVVDAQADELTGALKVNSLVEKPDAKQAASLAEDGKCSIVLGPYVFTHAVMDALVEDVCSDARLNGEVQLTPAVSRACVDGAGLLAVSLKGKSLDAGNPQEYASTMVELSSYVLPAVEKM